jgi:hypothetical protein
MGTGIGWFHPHPYPAGAIPSSVEMIQPLGCFMAKVKRHGTTKMVRPSFIIPLLIDDVSVV